MTWWERWRHVKPKAAPAHEGDPVSTLGELVARSNLDGPFEPPEGQDPEPPDLALALLVAARLLAELRTRLARERDPQAADLALRAEAVHAVLERLRTTYEGGR